MGFRNVVIESRCKCSYAGGYLVATRGDRTSKIHLSEIASLTFGTTQVFVSAYLLSELAKAKVPVMFCDEKYLPIAESLPLHAAYNDAGQIGRQLGWTEPSKKRVWQRVVRDKIRLQAKVLSVYGHEEQARVLMRHRDDVQSGDPTNREAVAAALYFSTLFGAPFKRDLECPLNNALDYGYTVILSKVAREVTSRGYLTQIGIHHRSELNSWNLACDLMEPFRPYIDIVIMRTDKDRFDVETRHQLNDITSDKVSFDDGLYKLGSVIGSYVQDCLDALNKKTSVAAIRCYEMT